MASVKAESHAAVFSAETPQHAESSQLNVAINIGGVVSTRGDHMVSARLQTRALGRRLIPVHKSLEEIFGPGSSSVSPLVGRYMRMKDLAKFLAAHNIPVSSLDYPDGKSYLEAGKDGAVSIYHGSLEDAMAHFGWARLNEGTPEKQAGRTRRALYRTRDKMDPEKEQVLKTNASFWIQTPRVGEELDEMLKKYQQDNGHVILAIEMDEQTQTPDEHFLFLDKKQEDYRRKNIRVGVFADIDLGHIQQARTINKGETPTALAFLAFVLSKPELAKRVRIISFNQYHDGDPRAHAQLDSGSIDFPKAATLIGESMAHPDGLDRNAVVLFEPNPIHYDWLVSPQGLHYFGRINRGFREGRGATVAPASSGAGGVDVYPAS